MVTLGNECSCRIALRSSGRERENATQKFPTIEGVLIERARVQICVNAWEEQGKCLETWRCLKGSDPDTQERI